MTREYFLKRAKEVHCDAYEFKDLPDNFNNKIKITAVCKKHGDFTISVVNFLNGRGCQKCAYENKPKRLMEKEFKKFIKKSKELHKNKYDYSKVEYINAKTKVCIICPEHGEFWQTPDAHTRGEGCYKCGRVVTGIKNRSNLDEFIEKSVKVHNGKYDYSKVEYTLDKNKVCIICPEHGEFWQRPSEHLRGSGCSKCSSLYRRNFDEFKTELIEKWGDIYDLSIAEHEYVNTITKITVICKYNGKKIRTTPSKLLIGNKTTPITYNRVSNTEEFIKKAKEVHGNKYDYSRVEYINSTTKVCIICPEHGEFWQRPTGHLRGSGCNICNKSIRKIRSKLEEHILNLLNDNNIKFIEQYSPPFLNEGLSHQKIDFYLPEYNISIECQGPQHVKKDMKFFTDLEKVIERDVRKYNKCKSNNIDILYFLESHIKIKDVLYNEKYENIYKEENTFRNDKLLLEKIKTYPFNEFNG